MISVNDTPECESWCRGFGYDDYLRVCEAMGTKGFLSKDGYKGACQFLDLIFERDVGIYREESDD